MARTRDWRTARKPVAVHEVTEQMLARARASADRSWLPQTVWPSRYVGRQFVGTDSLLVNTACSGMPDGAADGSQPLLTVLPSGYFTGY